MSFGDPESWRSWKKYRPPKCSRCSDTGLVDVDDITDDPSQPNGFRNVVYVYRCDCPAGGRYEQKFRLFPRDQP
jgi:hypothetical protein